MNKIKTIIVSVLALLLVITIELTSNEILSGNINTYNIYVNGEFIGNTNEAKKYYDYLDDEHSRLNEESQYGQVYMPNNFQIVKASTNENVNDDEKVYNEFKKGVEFLVNGYKVNVSGNYLAYNQTVTDENASTIEKVIKTNSMFYTTSKSVADEAFNKLLNTYVSSEEIDRLNRGETIDDLSVDQSLVLQYYANGTISGENQKVPYEKVVPKEDLYKYLLFGEELERKTYTVVAGDTFNSIAKNNNLSVEELSAANNNINKDVVLVPGQELIVDLPQPIIQIVSQKVNVVVQNIPYETVVITNDDMLKTDAPIVEVEGKNGEKNIVYEASYINGQAVSDATILETKVVSEPVSRIIVQGGKEVPGVGTGIWGKVTSGGIITSPFGPRWGSIHTGMDIAGLPVESPIYAADNGIVRFVGTDFAGAKIVLIDHQNGIASMYVHLNSFNVTEGQVVPKGYQIGGLGNTGISTGPHLHFETRTDWFYDGTKNIFHGTAVDPLSISPIFTP